MRYRCVKHWSAGLLTVLLAVVLAGCGGTAGQGGVAAPGNPTGPGSLDNPAELVEAVGSGGVTVAFALS